jgi:mRNA interferase RelE/StbE
MYEIIYDKEAEDFLLKLNRKNQKQILNRLERIRENPKSFLINLKNSSYCKIRIGKFKVFIDLQENKLLILVLEIGYRKNIYKN